MKSIINKNVLNNVNRCIKRAVTIEKNIEQLGLKMPTPAIPKGSFIQYNKIGNLVFVSGHLPQPAEGIAIIITNK